MTNIHQTKKKVQKSGWESRKMSAGATSIEKTTAERSADDHRAT